MKRYAIAAQLCVVNSLLNICHSSQFYKGHALYLTLADSDATEAGRDHEADGYSGGCWQ